MYNNIGLGTARGSGTNGFIERNLAHLSAPKQEFVVGLKRKKNQSLQVGNPKKLRADPSILEHQRKRKIEVLICNEEDRLENEGLDADTIAQRLSELREKLTKEFKSRGCVNDPNNKFGNGLHDTHAKNAKKMAKNAQFRAALGLSEMDDGSLKNNLEDERQRKREEYSANKTEIEKQEELLNRSKYHPLDHGYHYKKQNRNNKQNDSDVDYSSESDNNNINRKEKEKNRYNKHDSVRKERDRKKHDDSSNESDNDSSDSSEDSSSSSVIDISPEIMETLLAKHKASQNQDKQRDNDNNTKQNEIGDRSNQLQDKDRHSRRNERDRDRDGKRHGKHPSRSRSRSRSRGYRRR